MREGLGLENFYLYGQSWGSMLGIEYALKYQKHLKGLVLSSMTASIPAYMVYIAKLRAALPADIQATLTKYEATGQYEAPEYQEAMYRGVYGRHVCRLDPWPDPVARAFKHLNPQVYGTMQGPNEFVVTGTFKGWDRWADLPKIGVRLSSSGRATTRWIRRTSGRWGARSRAPESRSARTEVTSRCGTTRRPISGTS